MHQNDYRDKEVFATLTLPRTKSIHDSWKIISKLSNRFIQKIQRQKTVDKVEYLRVLEQHNDGFPHVHFHLRLGTRYPIRDRDKYLTDYWFKVFKKAGSGFGHTDFQCPRVNGTNTVRYVLKYISKTTGSRRLWSLILSPSFSYVPPATNDLGYPIKIQKYASWKLISEPVNQTLLYSTFKWQKIKLLTWSRGYTDTFKP